MAVFVLTLWVFCVTILELHMCTGIINYTQLSEMFFQPTAKVEHWTTKLVHWNNYCVVCSSSIYGFWLPLWYLQTLLWYPDSTTFQFLANLLFHFRFVFNYVYWCSTGFPYRMLFLSFKSKTTSVTSRAGTANPPRAFAFTPRGLMGFIFHINIDWPFIFTISKKYC